MVAKKMLMYLMPMNCTFKKGYVICILTQLKINLKCSSLITLVDRE